jgi:hypothetical protein
MFDPEFQRKFFGWLFAFQALLCVIFECLLIRSTLNLQLNSPFPHSRALVIDGLFPAAAVVFGLAWWKIWRDRPAARAWGIAASILTMAHPLWRVVRYPRSIHGYNVLVLAAGIAGLVVFSMRNQTLPNADEQEPEVPPTKGI